MLLNFDAGCQVLESDFSLVNGGRGSLVEGSSQNNVDEYLNCLEVLRQEGSLLLSAVSLQDGEVLENLSQIELSFLFLSSLANNFTACIFFLQAVHVQVDVDKRVRFAGPVPTSLRFARVWQGDRQAR